MAHVLLFDIISDALLNRWNMEPICYTKTSSVYDRFFFICSIKSPQCTDMDSKEKFLVAIFLPVF